MYMMKMYTHLLSFASSRAYRRPRADPMIWRATAVVVRGRGVAGINARRGTARESGQAAATVRSLKGGITAEVGLGAALCSSNAASAICEYRIKPRKLVTRRGFQQQSFFKRREDFEEFQREILKVLTDLSGLEDAKAVRIVHVFQIGRDDVLAVVPLQQAVQGAGRQVQLQPGHRRAKTVNLQNMPENWSKKVKNSTAFSKN